MFRQTPRIRNCKTPNLNFCALHTSVISCRMHRKYQISCRIFHDLQSKSIKCLLLDKPKFWPKKVGSGSDLSLLQKYNDMWRKAMECNVVKAWKICHKGTTLLTDCEHSKPRLIWTGQGRLGDQNNRTPCHIHVMHCNVPFKSDADAPTREQAGRSGLRLAYSDVESVICSRLSMSQAHL